MIGTYRELVWVLVGVCPSLAALLFMGIVFVDSLQGIRTIFWEPNQFIAGIELTTVIVAAVSITRRLFK